MILEKKDYIDKRQIYNKCVSVCVVGFDLGPEIYSGTICQRHNIINGMNQVHQLPYAHSRSA